MKEEVDIREALLKVHNTRLKKAGFDPKEAEEREKESQERLKELMPLIRALDRRGR